MLINLPVYFTGLSRNMYKLILRAFVGRLTNDKINKEQPSPTFVILRLTQDL